MRYSYAAIGVLVLVFVSGESFAAGMRTAGQFGDQLPPWVWILLGVATIGLSALFFFGEKQNPKIELIGGVMFFSLGCWAIFMGLW